MSAEHIPEGIRIADLFTHIDMGFLNRRLAVTALGPLRPTFIDKQKPGGDHFTQLGNDHLLVTMLIDVCNYVQAPTLAGALNLRRDHPLFMSIERLEACPEVYEAARVKQAVHLDFDCGRPVYITYHTSHIVSDTGRMTLASGYTEGHLEAIIGRLHNKEDSFEIEPLVIGSPWLDHPRNDAGVDAMWYGQDYGEVLPEDIAEFTLMRSVVAENADEWMKVMKNLPEEHVKRSIATLLREPIKSDWGGEENDHLSANVTVGSRRCTAAFLLKGPTRFHEMTLAMCGKNADQIYRLANTGADISLVQHSHLIGAAVRGTLRAMVVTPGRSRKFCVMDGQATYRLLKAYSMVPG